jgi:hypothetical protein
MFFATPVLILLYPAPYLVSVPKVSPCLLAYPSALSGISAQVLYTAKPAESSHMTHNHFAWLGSAEAKSRETISLAFADDAVLLYPACIAPHSPTLPHLCRPLNIAISATYIELRVIRMHTASNSETSAMKPPLRLT